ncbi:MAG TPA: DNA recombination protein RmuC [Terriglobales bacterium]|nr:DNA recombination protein RmuC [Terriglobales bacterium]
MNMVEMLVIAAVSVIAGGLVSLLFCRAKAAFLVRQNGELEQQLKLARTAGEQQAGEIRRLSEAKSALEAVLSTERRSHAEALATERSNHEELLARERQIAEEKLKFQQDTAEQLKSDFKALAASALQSNSDDFLRLAKSTLQTEQALAAGDLAQKEQAVKSLVDPIAQSLAGMNQQIQTLEQKRSEAYGTLSAQVQSLLETQRALQTETGNLVKAMREPQARGRWGELQLHRVLELAGMLEYCDFTEQETATTSDGRFRPDVIVKLPGDKNIVIDSKAPISAYLSALEAGDEPARRAGIVDHARQVRHHIDALSAKSYWAQFQPTPEFVVLFLPGEVFFRAALDGDFELIEYGISRHVIVTSPTTLIALLKAVAHGWNEKNLAESARRISDAGKDLYKRLCTMTGYIEELGKRLGGAVKAYDEMLRSMERRVFPLARRFPELDRSLPAQSLPELDPLDKTPFELQAPDWQETLDRPELDFGEEKADSAKAQ